MNIVPDLQKFVKKHKRRPIVDTSSESMVTVDYGKQDIVRVIPNRDPFVFLDRITGIDLKNQCITGSRKVLEDDPVFEGHFPGSPVYPGVLQLEMIAELFVALYSFISNNTTQIPDKASLPLVATRLHDAVLQHGVFPGDEVTIATKMLHCDDFTFTGVGQLIKGDKIPLLVIGEFYIPGE